jgi:hypothetical protein
MLGTHEKPPAALKQPAVVDIQPERVCADSAAQPPGSFFEPDGVFDLKMAALTAHHSYDQALGH